MQDSGCRSIAVSRLLLALLVHALLWRHRIGTLGLLLLLKVGLVLECLLVVWCHVGCLWGGVARHAGLWHTLWHRGRGAVGVLR